MDGGALGHGTRWDRGGVPRDVKFAPRFDCRAPTHFGFANRSSGFRETPLGGEEGVHCLHVYAGIVVLFAQTPHTRGALVAMAGLVGSVMVSYTKARAESIGVQCNVGFMERPERMICLVAGALLNLLEPALWTLAVLANLTALQRILFTRRVARAEVEARRPSARILGALLALPLLAGVAAAEAPGTPDVVRPTADVERTWTAAVAALQQGDPVPVLSAFAAVGRMM